jgi:hypothetical protein
MQIHRVFQNSAFDPEIVTTMAAAFDDACRELRLAPRAVILREVVAKKIIELTQEGERDRSRLCERTVFAIKQ